MNSEIQAKNLIYDKHNFIKRLAMKYFNIEMNKKFYFIKE